MAEAIVGIMNIQSTTNQFHLFPINKGSVKEAGEKVKLLREKIYARLKMLDKSIKIEEVGMPKFDEFTIEICSCPGLSERVVMIVLEEAHELEMELRFR